MIFQCEIKYNAFGSERQHQPLSLLEGVPLAEHRSTIIDIVIDPVNRLFECEDCDLKKENNILRSELAYWKSMHQKAKERESLYILERKTLQARIKQLGDMVFAQSSEKNVGKSGESSDNNKPKRKRGKQKGTPGHGRRKHKNLPVINEDYDLSEDEKNCPFCHLPFLPGFGIEESEVVEVDVKAHIRRIRRKRYIRGCACANVPAVITAKGPAKLIPRSVYGDSIWIEILLDKYYTFRPTHRLIQSLELSGLDIPAGTITDGLKRLLPFFKPVYEAIIIHNRTASHWHADETRWMVFSPVEGKIGYRWYLWVFESADSVVFIMDKTRSSTVPDKHFKEVVQGFLSVDRYAAYKVIAKDGRIVLVFCWAHVRRDFIVVAKGYPILEEWAMDWVQDIGALYQLNEKRLETEIDSSERIQAQLNLENAMVDMAQKRDEQLQQSTLHPACEKVLKSLGNHWNGLTLFVDHPELPMDNNSAERKLRGPVTGRKNFYGSGAEWSGTLSAIMFTIFQTLSLWNINPKTWLQFFFRACAENGSSVPDDLSHFLPWAMDEEMKQILKLPPCFDDTS